MTTENVLSGLTKIVGKKHVLYGEEKTYRYSTSIALKKNHSPPGVVLPADTKEVSEIMRFCQENGVKITLRGGGSNVVGGGVSMGSDFILSLERLNKVLAVNKLDRTITLEAGVLTDRVYEEATKVGLMYPQNISSSYQSFIGGNIALSSGSPRSLKYGSTKHSVLNLEVVLPSGEVMWTGKDVVKNATGYNLTQLFVGSEGTLGIITKAVLKLETPINTVLFLIPFTRQENLFAFVFAFFEEGRNAVCMEFLDKNAYKLVTYFIGSKAGVNEETECLLWVEIEHFINSDAEELYAFALKYTAIDILFAESESEKAKLWEYRKRVGDAAVNQAHYKDIDIVVPRSKSGLMYQSIQEFCKKHGFYFIVIGHIGDGNYHINIFDNGSPNWEEEVEICLDNIFNTANSLGGTLSGEHGIGILYKKHLEKIIPQKQILLMKKIKNLFDPQGILNPHAVFET